MENRLSLKNLSKKNIYDLGENFAGSNADGEEISFTNFYMMKNKRPFFGVSGNFISAVCLMTDGKTRSSK